MSDLGTLTVVFATGVLTGLLISYNLFKQQKPNNTSSSSSSSDELIDMKEPGIIAALVATAEQKHKMTFCVRTDLKMKPGKIASQCAHGAIIGFLSSRDKAAVKTWLAQGQKKVVLRVDSEDELMQIEASARNAGLTTGIVQDAGHTQVAPSSKTVLAIGPAPGPLIDKVTGDLRLLS